MLDDDHHTFINVSHNFVYRKIDTLFIDLITIKNMLYNQTTDNNYVCSKLINLLRVYIEQI